MLSIALAFNLGMMILYFLVLYGPAAANDMRLPLFALTLASFAAGVLLAAKIVER